MRKKPHCYTKQTKSRHSLEKEVFFKTHLKKAISAIIKLMEIHPVCFSVHYKHDHFFFPFFIFFFKQSGTNAYLEAK